MLFFKGLTALVTGTLKGYDASEHLCSISGRELHKLATGTGIKYPFKSFYVNAGNVFRKTYLCKSHAQNTLINCRMKASQKLGRHGYHIWCLCRSHHGVHESSLRIEIVIVISCIGCKTCKTILDARIVLFCKAWEKLKTYAVSRVIQACICTVPERLKSSAAAVGFDLAAGSVQQRSYDPVLAAVFHCCKSVDAGTPKDAHENRLSLIVSVVCEDDFCSSQFSGIFGQSLVTGMASGLFNTDPFVFSFCIDVAFHDFQCDAQLLAVLSKPGCILLSPFTSHQMIEVESIEFESKSFSETCKNMKKAEGIRSSGEAENKSVPF